MRTLMFGRLDSRRLSGQVFHLSPRWVCGLMFVLLLLLQVAVAEILILSPTLSQGEAKELSQQCLQALEGEEQLEVRISRFFVSGEGYQYRVVVAGFPTEKQARKTHKTLQDVNASFELQLDTQVFDVSKKEPKKVKERKSKKEPVPQQPEQQAAVEPNTDDELASDKRKFKDRLVPTSTDVLVHAQDAHSEICA